jgi:hypothetical protein
MNDTELDKECKIATHGWWVTSRPYRVMAELIIFSLISLILVMYVLSRTTDSQSYRFFGVNPIYIIGSFSGALGGLARSLIIFWKRKSYNMLRSDYWKHATPFYIGVLFGFLSTLVLQSSLKVIGVSNNISDSGGLSFVSMICLLSGLFADRAERKFLSIFDNTLDSERKEP